ncbi:amino acid permease [Fusibacter paucivorans]|uniref:Amino acid permease n=1 Tax=Fusibacter paucivorans TaxID=76009 RepID=A0ABS5PUE0_9FIRM|nr:APC family permease [Fusibacter paucivorans]MBS7528181.1 amino acid permease [Fusibacter paucivorans]
MQKIVNTPTPPPGKLGKGELYAIALGQVIGVGVITLVGPMIGLTGYSVWLAYAIAVVLGFISLLPYVFITSSLRFGAGPYSLVASTLDYRISGMLALAFIPTTLGMAAMGLSFGVYTNSLIPAIDSRVAGSALIMIFVIINSFGVNMMAKIQKVCSWLLISALVLFSIAGFFQINNPLFDVMADNFMANGNTSFVRTISIFMYSTIGYSLTMTYGKFAKNAKRDIPWAYIATAISLLILYTSVAITAAGVLPLADVAGKPMTAVARAILPAPLFVYFIVAGPMIALVTTINASIAYYQIPFKQACIDGWLPKSWNITNKHGASIPMLILVSLSGVLPQLFNFSIVEITSNLQLMTSCMSFIYFAAFFKFPKKFASAWQRSHMHVTDGLYYFLTFIALCIQFFIFYNSIKTAKLSMVIISMIAMLVCMSYGFFRAKSPQVQIQTSVWED